MVPFLRLVPLVVVVVPFCVFSQSEMLNASLISSFIRLVSTISSFIRLVSTLPCPLTWVCLFFVLFFGTLLQEVYLLYMQYFFCLFLILVRPFVQFCSLLTKLYDILRGNSHWPYSLTKYFTFTIVWTSTCLVSFPGPISFASSVSWLLWTEPTGWILHQLCKGFIPSCCTRRILVILWGSYVCTQRIHWMKFVVFIAETYVQLVITDLRAILPARLDRLHWACALDYV